MKNYFAILGLASDASEDDIKRAYRKQARTWHPDVNPDPGATARFVEINEAYEFLSDASLRKAYEWKHSNAAADFDERVRREAVYRMWMADQQARSRDRAHHHAAMPFDQFEKSAIYRTAMHLSRMYNYIFLGAGACMIFLPVLSYLLQDPNLPEDDRITFAGILFPMAVGGLFVYGIYYFLFKLNHEE